MNVEMSGDLVLIALLIPAGVAVALLRSPRWFARSLSKHAMWRLRDAVVDDTLEGRLPADHPAVKELIARVEWAIDEARSFDLLHLLVWTRARRRLSQDSVRKLETLVSLNGLSEAQASRVKEHRGHYNLVAIRALLVSSWLGVAVVLWYVIPLAFKVSVRELNLPTLIRQAVARTAETPRLGRSARTFVTDKGPAAKLA